MTSAYAMDYATLASSIETSAVSDTAAHVQEQLGNLFRANESMRSLSGREVAFEVRLRVALNELVTGDDQSAVPAAAVHLAARLVRALPASLPAPEVAIDPDGEISLDWMPAKTRAFSISVGDTDRLAYAWMSGSDRGHGVVRLADSIPRSLLLQLTELVSDGAAFLRAA